MAMSILAPRLQTPISAIMHSRHFANTISNGPKSDFSSLVATGNEPAVDESRQVEGKLAGMLLGNLMQFILPARTDELTGPSLSDDYWKSFLADAIADSMVKSGKIDLQISR